MNRFVPADPADRVPEAPRDEGVVLVWVALMLVVLVGMGALVIDIGALYVEKRELQNGADAAALAVAQDCAAGSCEIGEGSAALARDYANLNAHDRTSAVDPTTPCGYPSLRECSDSAPAEALVERLQQSGATGWVHVGTSTQTDDGGDEVSFLLAPVISSLTGKTVTASATAAWGPLQTGTTLPFAFSECEFNRLPLDDDGIPIGTTYVYAKDDGQNPASPDCESRVSSGGTVKGGFGWLEAKNRTCVVELDVGQVITGPGEPGNNDGLDQSGCDKSRIKNEEVLLPLFGAVESTGQNATYTIVGFVGFVVTGFQLAGGGPNGVWPADFDCRDGTDADVPGNKLRCFRGNFTQFYSSVGDFGGSRDFGARVIKMVG